jgi:hypothetical protein
MIFCICPNPSAMHNWYVTSNVVMLMTSCGKDKLRTSLAGAVDIVRICYCINFLRTTFELLVQFYMGVLCISRNPCCPRSGSSCILGNFYVYHNYVCRSSLRDGLDHATVQVSCFPYVAAHLHLL